MIKWPDEQPVLTGDGFSLRPLRATDATAVAAWCADPLTIMHMPIPVPYTEEHAASSIARKQNWFAERSSMSLGIETEGQLAGEIGVHNVNEFDHWCEIGYVLAPEFRGRGIATKAVTVLSGYIFAIGFCRIQAQLPSDNEKSEALLKRAGFEFEARNRMSMTRRDGVQFDGLTYSLVAPHLR